MLLGGPMNGDEEIKFKHLEQGRKDVIAPPRALKDKSERKLAARGRSSSYPPAERKEVLAIKNNVEQTLDLAKPGGRPVAAPLRRPKSQSTIFKGYDTAAENAISLIPVSGGTLKALMMAKETVKNACFLMGHAKKGLDSIHERLHNRPERNWRCPDWCNRSRR